MARRMRGWQEKKNNRSKDNKLQIQYFIVPNVACSTALVVRTFLMIFILSTHISLLNFVFITHTHSRSFSPHFSLILLDFASRYASCLSCHSGFCFIFPRYIDQQRPTTTKAANKSNKHNKLWLLVRAFIYYPMFL